MSAEYILLVALFAFFIMGALIKGPHDSFRDAAPKLGARVEKHLITGDGFTREGRTQKWETQ